MLLRKSNFKYRLAYDMFKLEMQSFLLMNSHIGNEISRWNPNMKNFLWGIRQNFYILNLEYSLVNFRRVLHLLSKVINLRSNILFVTENLFVDFAVKKIASLAKQPYSFFKWVGGTFTNMKYVFTYLRFINFVILSPEGRVSIPRFVKNLRLRLQGYNFLINFPRMAFILNTDISKNAIHELRSLRRIVTFGLVDSSSNLKDLDFNIIGNNFSLPSVVLYSKLIGHAIHEFQLRELILFKRYMNYKKQLFHINNLNKYLRPRIRLSLKDRRELRSLRKELLINFFNFNLLMQIRMRNRKFLHNKNAWKKRTSGFKRFSKYKKINYRKHK